MEDYDGNETFPFARGWIKFEMCHLVDRKIEKHLFGSKRVEVDLLEYVHFHYAFEREKAVRSFIFVKPMQGIRPSFLGNPNPVSIVKSKAISLYILRGIFHNIMKENGKVKLINPNHLSTTCIKSTLYIGPMNACLLS